MNKKNKVNLIKKLTAGMLAMGMIVMGIVIVPKQADAEGTITIKNTVIYDTSYSIADYWDDGKKAPIKEGYVFGGWFREDENTAEENKETLTSEDGQTMKICVPLNATDIDTNNDKKVDEGVTAIAKFVPAQVLSVKAQNGVKEGRKAITQASDISDENPMWVRVMTSQDSKNYQTIGFDILLANKKKPTNSADNTDVLESDKVFEKVKVKGVMTEAEDIFGSVSRFVSVWQLDEINVASNANKIIYVRPYWKTMDGTKVYGLAKYVHIEDDYKNYISVPVNILSETDKEIAAGMVNMLHDQGLTIAKDESGKVLFETGRIFPEMQCHYDEAQRSIKMVGNSATVGDEYKSEESIYANLRFEKPAISENTTFNFDMTLDMFCDWDEEVVTNGQEVKVWDIAYEVKASTNE